MLFLFLLLLANGADAEFKYSATENIKTRLVPMSIPALGRAFSLGDLYDRRRDEIVPGPKIWSNEELAEYDETKTHSTNFQVSTGMSINQGLSHFDIKASMKMSFLSGMISVAGSAAYLQDKMMNNNNARVSLKYSSTTFKRSIRPVTFTRATHPTVLQKVKAATDVVAAIQYGAGAVFVFDRVVSKSESKRDIEGMLAVSVKKIPSFHINGTGAANISHADRKITENFTCKFHGDFVLEEHPGNYEEAIRVYKQLPELLGEEYENSIPIKVWLYPIEMLPLGKEPVTLFDVQENIITKIGDEVEMSDDVIRRSNDLLDTFTSAHHPRIKHNLEKYQQYVKLYMMNFKQELAVMLPHLREGSKGSKDLVDFLEKKNNSPFNIRLLTMWIDSYQEEVTVLSTLANLPNYCKDKADFGAMLLNDKRYTVSLILRLNTQADHQLNEMKKYLRDGSMTMDVDEYMENEEKKPKWWKAGSELLATLQRYAAMIKKFNAIQEERIKNGAGSDTQFVIMEEIVASDHDQIEVFVNQYENGKLKQENIAIPTDVENLQIVATEFDRIKLKWNPPAEGAKHVVKYEVVAYARNTEKVESPKCDELYCEVEKTTTTNNEVAFTGLEAARDYAFVVQTHCFLGMSAETAKTEFHKTTKCPPGMHHTDEHHCSPCSPGTYTEKYGETWCPNCPMGQYSDKFGSASCPECPKGTYNSQAGVTLSGCIKCPAGTYGPNEGAIGFWECRGCSMGTYNDKMGQASDEACLKCPKGSYSSNSGSSQCELCPFGSKTDEEGSMFPSDCHRPTQVLDEVKAGTENIVKTAEKNIAFSIVQNKALSAKTEMYSSEYKGAKSSSAKKLNDLIKDARDLMYKKHYVDKP